MNNYQYNNNAYNKSYNRGGYQGVPFRNQPAYQPVYGQQMPSKKSGAKRYQNEPEKGENKGRTMISVYGWKASKRFGLSLIKARMTKKSVVGKKGWCGSVAITVTNVNTGQQTLYWGMMKPETGKVVIKELGFVMNPAAANGGYCGSYKKRRR